MNAKFLHSCTKNTQKSTRFQNFSKYQEDIKKSRPYFLHHGKIKKSRLVDTLNYYTQCSNCSEIVKKNNELKISLHTTWLEKMRMNIILNIGSVKSNHNLTIKCIEKTKEKLKTNEGPCLHKGKLKWNLLNIWAVM